MNYDHRWNIYPKNKKWNYKIFEQLRLENSFYAFVNSLHGVKVRKRSFFYLLFFLLLFSPPFLLNTFTTLIRSKDTLHNSFCPAIEFHESDSRILKGRPYNVTQRGGLVDPVSPPVYVTYCIRVRVSSRGRTSYIARARHRIP